MHRIWILLLTPSFRYGRWLIALIIFLTTFLYQRQFIAENQLNQSTQLFFSLLFAYIVPVFSFIIERTEHYVECLRSCSALPDEEFQILKDSLSQRSIGWVIATVSFSLLLAFGQLTMIWGSPTLVLSSLVESLSSASATVITFLLWIVMTTVITVLIDNARTLAKFGRDHLAVSVLNRRNLLPFGDVAVISTLALIGTLAFYPLMMIDGARTEAVLPGLLATGLPMLMLFIIPMWPVHKRLMAMKRAELDLVAMNIEAESGKGTSPAGDFVLLQRIMPLLSYQRELNQMSTWPIDMGSMSRLSLYLIIPPLTWVGAALIENLVDGFL